MGGGREQGREGDLWEGYLLVVLAVGRLVGGSKRHWLVRVEAGSAPLRLHWGHRLDRRLIHSTPLHRPHLLVNLPLLQPCLRLLVHLNQLPQLLLLPLRNLPQLPNPLTQILNGPLIKYHDLRLTTDLQRLVDRVSLEPDLLQHLNVVLREIILCPLLTGMEVVS